jgi:Na+-transporting NADH:ubiquinone oxidoreductase subunit NqrB
MSRLFSHPFWSDARHFQIAALASLVFYNIGWIDFGAQPFNTACAIFASVATQVVCTRFYNLPQLDLRSPLITGLSLSLLLRAESAWIFALAGIIGIAAKFIIRINGKHIWNPAGIAIVVLLFTTGGVWISPGAWGTAAWFITLLAFLAIMVLHAARRSDMAIFFLACHGALLLARAAWLGDPLAIPLHQMQSGALLIFAFFMISDPRTSPDSRLGRFLFALSVALLAHYLAFFIQMRPALYLALVAISPLTLLIDRLLPAERFNWTRQDRTQPALQGASR